MEESIWRVIFIASDPQRLEGAEHLLAEEGFLVRRRAQERTTHSNATVELLVLKSEAEEARNCLMENGLQ